MTPSAQLKAVVELLDEFHCSSYPLDILTGNYFRRRRYVGSKDRRKIKNTLYKIIRDQVRIRYVLQTENIPQTSRNMLLAYLSLSDSFDSSVFDGSQYGLKPMTESESDFLKKLGEIDIPDWALLNCPLWLGKKLKVRFGDDFEQELKALNERAPLCLRVNTLKTNMKNAGKVLEPLGFKRTSLGSTGYTAARHVQMNTIAGYQEGHFEVQDEGSQFASMLAAANQAQQVLDLCAGAGGKALALAALMQNKGQIFAFDIDKNRLDNLHKRAMKMGAHNIQLINETGLRGLQGKMDKVLLDVPCSGTGTWRRNPELRVRLTPEKLTTYTKLQKKLLFDGIKYLKPGGQLIYITCSLLPEENEEQIKAFLDSHKGWALDKKIKPVNRNRSMMDNTIQLTPGSHGTDGFFIACLDKPAIYAK